MSNGDKIRAMTDEELACWFVEHIDCGEGCPVFSTVCHQREHDCELDLLDWLKQEVTG